MSFYRHNIIKVTDILEDIKHILCTTDNGFHAYYFFDNCEV